MSENDFTPIPDGFKKCYQCKEVKSVSEYYKNPYKPDGLEIRCKICESLRRGHKPKPPKPDSEFFPEQGIVKIPLTKGYIAIIDMVDADLARIAWQSFETPNSDLVYARRSIRKPNKQTLLLHRVIFERVLGRILLPEETIDHEDRNGLNCRRENLRLATRSENSCNRKRPTNNKSGYRGVYFDKVKRRWIAYIGIDGEHFYLGQFDTIEEAIQARVAAAKELHREFARFD